MSHILNKIYHCIDISICDIDFSPKHHFNDTSKVVKLMLVKMLIHIVGKEIPDGESFYSHMQVWKFWCGSNQNDTKMSIYWCSCREIGACILIYWHYGNESLGIILSTYLVLFPFAQCQIQLGNEWELRVFSVNVKGIILIS